MSGIAWELEAVVWPTEFGTIVPGMRKHVTETVAGKIPWCSMYRRPGQKLPHHYRPSTLLTGFLWRPAPHF